jgi:hypothetical protein
VLGIVKRFVYWDRKKVVRLVVCEGVREKKRKTNKQICCVSVVFQRGAVVMQRMSENDKQAKRVIARLGRR